MCSSRQVCTKKAYEDILPRGLLGSPLPMVTGGVHLAGDGRWVGARGARLPAQTRARSRAPPRGSPSAPAPDAAAPPGPPHPPPTPSAQRPGRRRPRSGPGGGGNAAGVLETPFLTEMSPGFHVARPTQGCRLATDIKKRAEPSPDEPPARPPQPVALTGPHPRFRPRAGRREHSAKAGSGLGGRGTAGPPTPGGRRGALPGGRCSSESRRAAGCVRVTSLAGLRRELVCH